jgi:hypothetical protein
MLVARSPGLAKYGFAWAIFKPAVAVIAVAISKAANETRFRDDLECNPLRFPDVFTIRNFYKGSAAADHNLFQQFTQTPCLKGYFERKCRQAD